MPNNDDEAQWFSATEAALAVGLRLFTTEEEFNEGCDHVVRLIKDASILLSHGSHATAVFLSITAIEEIAKLHIGSYRRSAQKAKLRIPVMVTGDSGAS